SASPGAPAPAGAGGGPAIPPVEAEPGVTVTDVGTREGAAVGTPAYMSPEQAAGELGRIGPASDVYSLGATLYPLRAGVAPVQGRDAADILERVRRGAVVPPRRRRKHVPAALDAVCRKAMAPRPEDRYATALDLAADVERWLAGEAVRVFRDPWW